MVDQLISFETAKLAKEKGFISKSPYYQIDDADEIDLVDMKGFPLHSNDQEGDYYEAPTQSLLQKWLWEKHGIFIEIQFSPTSKSFRAKVFYPKSLLNTKAITELPDSIQYDPNFNNSEYFWIYCKPDHMTPENTIEPGLIEALKLIP